MDGSVAGVAACLGIGRHALAKASAHASSGQAIRSIMGIALRADSKTHGAARTVPVEDEDQTRKPGRIWWR